MRGDMVVAHGPATVDGISLFGHYCLGDNGGSFGLIRTKGREHALGEKVSATFLELPQVRRTYGVLASTIKGLWGYVHGVNDRGVAVGCTPIRTRLTLENHGLPGTDLVRLALERSHSAWQALEVVTSLIARHGQGSFLGCPPLLNSDAAFLIADAQEAFVIEASGKYWVYQEVQQIRSLTNLCTIRQDWDAIAPGLAGHCIEQQWWPEDGTKLDFAGVLEADPETAKTALGRWGKATWMLEQQNGHIDAAFLRRLLSGSFHQREMSLPALPRTVGSGPQKRPLPLPSPGESISLVVEMNPRQEVVPLAWWSIDPTKESLYFPIPLAGNIPEPFSTNDPSSPDCLVGRLSRLSTMAGVDRQHRRMIRAALEERQAAFEGETTAFLGEVTALKTQGQESLVPLQAEQFMRHCWTRFVEVTDELFQAAGANRELPTFC
jgi:hypothetical protein